MRQALIVTCRAAEAGGPGEAALQHPSPGEQNDSPLGLRQLDDLQADALDAAAAAGSVSVSHVPDMAGRYYGVQFTDPSEGADFAYVGARTMGTAAGAYRIRGPGWRGTVSQGMPQIASPHNNAKNVRTTSGA